MPKQRCAKDGCKKKIGLINFTCNCGLTFCTLHRLAESHKCTYDFQKEGKQKLEEKNPKIIKDKIENRI